MRINYESIMDAVNASRHASYLSPSAEFIDTTEPNYTGQEINGKLVIQYLGTGAHYEYMWLVQCLNCSRLSVIENKTLTLQRKTNKCKHCKSSKSFDSTTPFYKTWKKLIDRITNPKNKRYYYYKLADITLCEEWLVYDNFKNDMYGTYIRGSRLVLNSNCSEFSKKNVRWR